MNYNENKIIKSRLITGILMFLFFLFFFLIFFLMQKNLYLLLSLGFIFVINACKEMFIMFDQKKPMNLFHKLFIIICNMMVFLWAFCYFINIQRNTDHQSISITQLLKIMNFQTLFILVFLISFIFFVFSSHFKTKDLGIHFIIIIYISFNISIFLSFFNLEFMGFLIMFIAFLTDIFSFLIGYYFGKTNIFPQLSPNKTLEGYLAGSLITTFFIFLFFYFFKHDNFTKTNIFIFLIIIFFTSIIAQVGDLITSKFKRNYNIKDFGNIFPGHGGFLDRFDSILFVSLFIKFLESASILKYLCIIQ